jgi:thiol-disulfide isomerase/thioredoxin
MRNITKRIKTMLLIALAVILSCANAIAQTSLAEFEHKMRLHSGKVVYLDFWASWCVPCRQSFPWLNAMQAAHQQQGFVVLSINLDTKMSHAKAFLEKHPANFDIIYDNQGLLSKKFALKGMPSSYLFNRQGKIIANHLGFNQQKKQNYQQEIIDTLAVSSPKNVSMVSQ